MITLDHKGDHMKTNSSYFQTQKINVTKVGTEKEDEKIESGFQTSLDMVLKMSKIFFY